jgi:hypothetical protein
VKKSIWGDSVVENFKTTLTAFCNKNGGNLSEQEWTEEIIAYDDPHYQERHHEMTCDLPDVGKIVLRSKHDCSGYELLMMTEKMDIKSAMTFNHIEMNGNQMMMEDTDTEYSEYYNRIKLSPSSDGKRLELFLDV